MSRRTVRVAVAHVAPEFMDRAKTTDKVIGCLEDFEDQNVDLAVFPESLIPGFPYWVNLVAPLEQGRVFGEFWENAVRRDGPAVRRLADATESLGLYALVGATLRQGETLYNAQLLFGPRGFVDVRRKLVLTFAERTTWGTGDGSDLTPWETELGTLGGLICWEHMMNNPRQALISQGEEIHLGSWPGLRSLQGFGHADKIARTLMKAHALTGQVFVATAMNPCPPSVMDWMEDRLGEIDLQSACGGWSAIINPQGQILEEESGEEDTVLRADLDMDEIRDASLFCDTDGHYSRPDVLTLSLDQRPKVNLTVRGSDEEEPPDPQPDPPVGESSPSPDG